MGVATIPAAEAAVFRVRLASLATFGFLLRTHSLDLSIGILLFY